MDIIADFIGRTVTDRMTAFDVGANLGRYTRSLSERAGQVFAFEPIPAAAQTLRELQLAKVRVIEAAVSDKEGEANFHVDMRPEFNGDASSLVRLNDMDGVTKSIRVHTLSLDAFCIANRIKPGFIKIDAEGHERFVLKGAKRTIEKLRPFLVFEFWETWWEIGGFNEIFDWLAPRYNMTVLQTGEDAKQVYMRGNRPCRNGVSLDIACEPKSAMARWLGLARRHYNPVRSVRL